MKAVVYKGPHNVAVENVEDPQIQAPTDAILKVTSAAICGSDLHMYDGCTVASPGVVLGHEIMGIVEEIGPDGGTLKKGDRVVLPFNIACGFCYNCVRGYPNACLNANPHGVGAAYGYVGLGPYRGGQAEYVRVPYAYYECLKLPGQPGDQWEDDFLLLSDVFPTAYHATELAHVKAGSSVAIFGAGPIGLLSAYSALLRGATEVYVVDAVPDRLKKAEQIGATPVDASKGNPVDQIVDLRRNRVPPGEEKMGGVMCGIDAVGYQAIDYWGSGKPQSNVVLEALVRLVNPTGHIGVIGVYPPQDPCGETPGTQKGQLELWFGKLWGKSISVGTGPAPVPRYNRLLRDLIISGRAKPSFIVTQRLPIDDAPQAYQKFDERADGFVKVVLKPGLMAA